MIVTTTYRYCRERSMVGDFGRVWFDEPRSILLTAECEQIGDESSIVFTADTLDRMRAAELTDPEREGCIERIEDEFWWARAERGEVAA